MIRSRSPIVRLGIQAASPLALVVATYLFFAGHNRPGGGFAAGLVFGAVIALRAVAGMKRPGNGIGLVSVGVLVAGGLALARVIGGDLLLDQVVVEGTLPLLGKVKVGTALVFDAGVTLVVIGLVVAVLDGLGAAELAAPAPRSASGVDRCVSR